MAAHESEYIIHHGKNVGYGATSNGSFTMLDDTRDVGFPEPEFGTAETTNDSTPNFTKAYIPGLKEPGKLTFSYVYGKTQFTALDTIFALNEDATTRATSSKYWKVLLADGSFGVAKGFMTKHALPPGDGEDVVTVDVEIQITSKWAFTAYVPA